MIGRLMEVAAWIMMILIVLFAASAVLSSCIWPAYAQETGRWELQVRVCTMTGDCRTSPPTFWPTEAECEEASPIVGMIGAKLFPDHPINQWRCVPVAPELIG